MRWYGLSGALKPHTRFPTVVKGAKSKGALSDKHSRMLQRASYRFSPSNRAVFSLLDVAGHLVYLPVKSQVGYLTHLWSLLAVRQVFVRDCSQERRL